MTTATMATTATIAMRLRGTEEFGAFDTGVEVSPSVGVVDEGADVCAEVDVGPDVGKVEPMDVEGDGDIDDADDEVGVRVGVGAGFEVAFGVESFWSR
jgi:hypothetical protein